MTALASRQERWLRLAASLGDAVKHEGEQVAQIFAPEMAAYGELIAHPPDGTVGFMVRGGDLSFTERAAALMRRWQMPDEAIAHHAAVAHLCEHEGAFLKLEWRPAPAGSPAAEVERLIAFYYRRLPSVDDVLEQLAARGVAGANLEQVSRLARILAKDEVHFVAGAMRPGRPLHHKLYLTQYLSVHTWPAVAARVSAAAEAFGVQAAAQACRAQYHDALAPVWREGSLFVSLSFTDAELVPSIKLDYPCVTPRIAAALLPLDQQAAAEAQIRRLCELAGTRELSFLGVRLHRSAPLALKYYCDFPGAQR